MPKDLVKYLRFFVFLTPLLLTVFQSGLAFVVPKERDVLALSIERTGFQGLPVVITVRVPDGRLNTRHDQLYQLPESIVMTPSTGSTAATPGERLGHQQVS
jgi:hypothetical protein